MQNQKNKSEKSAEALKGGMPSRNRKLGEFSGLQKTFGFRKIKLRVKV